MAVLALFAISCVEDKPFPGEAEEVDYTGLVINEVDGNGKFVELYNNGTEAIPLRNVYLVKNESGTWWTGAGNVTIPAGGFYAIVQSGQTTAGGDEYTGASGISAKQTLKFELFTPEDESLSVFSREKAGVALGTTCTPDYGSGTQYSFGRAPDGTGAFVLTIPSIKAANGASQGAIVTD